MLRFSVSRSSKSLFSAPFVFAAFLIGFAPVSSDAAADPELGQVHQVGSGSPGAVVAGICGQPHPGQSFFSSRQSFIFAIRRLCSSLWSNSLQDCAGHSQGAAPFHQHPLVEVMATFLFLKCIFWLFYPSGSPSDKQDYTMDKLFPWPLSGIGDTLNFFF